MPNLANSSIDIKNLILCRLYIVNGTTVFGESKRSRREQDLT
jgi:hypothetical protein